MKSGTRSTRSSNADVAPLAEDVASVRDQIAARFDPEAIILFGSTVAGRGRPDSDIDMLIIKRTTQPYFDRVLQVRRLIKSDRRLDAIVLTPEEYDKAIEENRYLLVKEILPTGRTIYERPRARRRRPRVD